jgi:predicted MFS family arabinose efflux permease
MTIGYASPSDTISDRAPVWGAVFAMALCCMVLVASEFMPVSLLTPIASDLHMTEGQAGQVISISGIFAVFTSLFISSLTAGRDRRFVLSALALSLIVSGSVVAFAPNYTILMVGRAVLGIAIGGFWSMSTAAVMRLVPKDHVPRALAVLQGGTALAATVAAPLGSFLGGYIGWRGAFFCVIPLAAIALAWLLVSLPSMHTGKQTGSRNVFRLFRLPVVAYGMAAVTLFFMGQFALFTYLRPFLEMVTGVDVSTLSLILLLLGVTGLAGTFLIGLFLKNGAYGVMIVIPLAMAGIAASLIVLGNQLAATAALLGTWGLLGTPAPVAWNTWLARTLPEDAEAGGGLMVAAIQLAITLGATIGGFLFDRSGYQTTFTASAVMLVAAGLLACVAKRAAAST